MNNKLFKHILTGLFVLLAFSACRDEDFPEVGQPAIKGDLIQGTWAVSNIYLNDEDISDTRLSANDGTINAIGGFTVDFTASGYTINSNGLPSPVSTASGTWAFDDADYPTAISMNGDTDVTLGSVPTTGSDSFTIEFVAGCGGNTYRYVLVKQ